MSSSQFAQSRGDFRAMARSPSYRAPRACDVLNPSPFEPPLGPRMCAEERKLLDAVIANRDDDEPRRVMAEWLIANGDEVRGWFILGQLDSCSPLPSFGGEGLGVRGLDSPRQPSTPTHSLTPLTQPSPPEAGGEGFADVFAPWSARDLVRRRGFVEGMSLAGRAFISIGAPLFDMTPLREVRLVAVQPYLTELAACPHLAKLESLDLRGNHIGDDGLRLLAPSVSRLMKLNLVNNSLTERSLPIVHSFRARGVEIALDATPARNAA